MPPAPSGPDPDLGSGDPAANDVAEGLIRRLEREQALWQRLFELASRQAELFSADNPVPLQALLSLRGQLLGRIAAGRSALERDRPRWEAACQAADPARRARIEALMGEIEQRRARVAAMDEQLAGQARHLRGEALEELQRVDRGGRLTRAYIPGRTPQSPAYTDHRG